MPSHQLVRWVQVVRGSMEFRLECRPAFNYGRDLHTAHVVAGGVCFESPGLSMGLGTREKLRVDGNGVVSQFTLHESTTLHFGLADSTEVESIEVEWIGGMKRVIRHPEIDRYHHVLASALME